MRFATMKPATAKASQAGRRNGRSRSGSWRRSALSARGASAYASTVAVVIRARGSGRTRAEAPRDERGRAGDLRRVERAEEPAGADDRTERGEQETDEPDVPAHVAAAGGVDA